MELHYHKWNPTQIPTGKSVQKIVFLHGMGGTGALWRPIAASLEEEFSLLALDQRGHGKSQVPHLPGGRTEPKYTPLDYGQDVVETLEALDFHPAWVVGHSMGVRTAVATAHLRSQWVKGLVLIDLGFSGVAGGGLGENLAQFLRLLPQSFPSREKARQFMNESCPDPSIAQYLMAVSVRDAQGRLHFPFDHSALIQTIAAARDSSVREWVRELGSQNMPILVLRGANSLVWNKEQFVQEKESFSRFPSIQFEEIQNAGHGLPFEQRPVFVSRLREFMSSNP